LDEEVDCLGQLKVLENELETFKSTYGFDPTLTLSQDQIIQALQDKISKELAFIDQSRKRVDDLQSVSTHGSTNYSTDLFS
jgi:hypothetical protein